MITFTSLPLYKDSDYSYSAVLNNVSVSLRFIYNTKTKHYHMTVKLPSGNAVIDGVKIVERHAITSTSAKENGLVGAFYLTPRSAEVVASEETMRHLPDYYLLSFIS